MNIKNFLMDNYIYIIIVILLTIITIIGFLADKKKNGNKAVKTMSGTINNNQNQNVGNIAYQQPMDLNQPINNLNQPNNFGGLSNNMMPLNQFQNPDMQNSSILNNQPLNNQSVTAQSPLNNPVLMNQPVNNLELNNNMMQQVNPLNQMGTDNFNTPQPVEPLNQPLNQGVEPMAQPIMNPQPMNNPMTEQVPNPAVSQDQSFFGQQNNPGVVETPIMSEPAPINMAPVQEPQIVNQPMQPQMPANQPVSPIPNPTGTTVPNPITPPTPVGPQPVNFVYGQGAQNINNNNQFMQ